MPPRLAYSAALDGLRAFAVVAVIGYHLDISWMRGGFLGVDLFFVISGFLITRLLLDEQSRDGRIALGGFWVRRFRRLVPPLVVVVAVTVAATYVWGDPGQVGAMRGDAAAALGYVANWRFVLNGTSYFDTLGGPSPLRHIWSLAVEEQWYAFWPLVMMALAPWALRDHGRRRQWMFAVVAGAAAISAVWMAVLFDPADISRVYYGTDTRAQQLLIGASLAFFSVGWPALVTDDRLRRMRTPSITLLVVFAAAVVLVDDESAWLYRGGLLAFSIGAAGLVMVSSVPSSDGPLGWLGRAPLVAIGRRSYGLYLWHWPVIIFVGPAMGIELSAVPLGLLQIVVTASLNELMYRWIESPVRASRRRPLGLLAGWSLGGVGVAVIALAVLVADLPRLPDIDVLRPDPVAVAAAPPAAPTSTLNVPRPPTTDRVTDPKSDPKSDPASGPVATDGVAQAAPLAALPTAPPAPPPPAKMMLLGDSTALVLAVGKPDDRPSTWQSIEYARVGCAITDGNTIDVGDTKVVELPNASECPEWETDWADLSRDYNPTLSVVMVGAWEVLDHVVDGQRSSFPEPAWSDQIEQAVRRGVDAATTGGGRVALLRLPCMEQATGSLVDAQARNDPERVAAFNAILETVAASSPDVITLPLDELLCPGGQPIGEIDGQQIRYDGVHLTDTGIRLVWDWLDGQLLGLDTSVS